jgi:hypothetical protein
VEGRPQWRRGNFRGGGVIRGGWSDLSGGGNFTIANMKEEVTTSNYKGRFS